MTTSRRLARDPIARSSVLVWLVVAAFYVVPGVPEDVRKRMGDTYSTLPIWPWAIAGALVEFSSVRNAAHRRLWRWLAVSFASLLAIETVRAMVAAGGAQALDLPSEAFYMGFYAALLLSALAWPARGRASSARWLTVALCATLAVAFPFAASAWPSAYGSGLISGAVYLPLDAVATWLWWRNRPHDPGPWRTSFTLISAGAFLFLVTDMLALLHGLRLWRFTSGSPTDLLWTLPALAFALGVRAGRLADATPNGSDTI